MADNGMPVCEACWHQHAGMRLGGICIGCPCPYVGGKVVNAFMSKMSAGDRSAPPEEAIKHDRAGDREKEADRG